MAIFEDGVTSYLEAEATVKVNFPNGETKCIYCPFLSANERRCYIDIHKEVVVYEPKKGVGWGCPLKPKEEVKLDG